MAHIPKIISLIFFARLSKMVQGEKSISSYTVKKRTVPRIHLGWICTRGSQTAATAQVHWLVLGHLPGKEHFHSKGHCYRYFYYLSLYSLFNSHSNGLSKGWNRSPAAAANCSSARRRGTTSARAADGRDGEGATQAEKQFLGDSKPC